jgi:hypothetical protein
MGEGRGHGRKISLMDTNYTSSIVLHPLGPLSPLIHSSDEEELLSPIYRVRRQRLRKIKHNQCLTKLKFYPRPVGLKGPKISDFGARVCSSVVRHLPAQGLGFNPQHQTTTKICDFEGVTHFISSSYPFGLGLITVVEKKAEEIEHVHQQSKVTGGRQRIVKEVPKAKFN